MTDIQSAINELAQKTDRRISVFDIEIEGLKNSSLKLSGRLLHESQLDDLRQALPELNLDLSSVQILDREAHLQVYVATNLTGLYEKPTFGMPLSSELTYGTGLEVLETEKQWAFTRQADGYLGWVYRPYLSEGTPPKATHFVLAPSVEVRTEPDEQSEVVTRLVSGTGVTAAETCDSWICISANRSGWIPSKYLRSLENLPMSVDAKRSVMIVDAKRMAGVPYLWGGTGGSGIDCSGFARLLHRWIGIEIPRDADMQHTSAKPVEPPFEMGDLFFFSEEDSSRKITHVGISLGGWTMIHSSRSNNGVYVDDLRARKSLMDIFVSAGSYLR